LKHIILGIDPGSQVTGYGVIAIENKKLNYMTSGCIRVAKLAMPLRLKEIFSNIQLLIEHYQPNFFSIEQIFMHRNAKSALILGQARGVAIAAAAMNDLPVAEYSARQVKQSLVGYGAAEKIQVQHMVKQILNLVGAIQADAADALAIAICHAHHQSQSVQIG
jgi:crossover junction endodeoxyribonuclease RuvC